MNLHKHQLYLLVTVSTVSHSKFGQQLLGFKH